MSTVIQTIKNKQTGDTVLPRTSTTAITTTDGSLLDVALADLQEQIDNIDLSADNVTYDNTTSGLTADDVQGAIDELKAEKVPTTRTVNSKALASDITISQTDVGGAEILLKSESYTLSLTDNYKLNKCLSASTITVTIPLNSEVAFPVGSEIVLARYGAGAVTLSATSGVTLYSSDSKKSINKQYEFATLKKIATDEWVLLGSLSA